jgi:hypothetical protein
MVPFGEPAARGQAMAMARADLACGAAAAPSGAAAS